jgi:hypothetical protein
MAIFSASFDFTTANTVGQVKMYLPIHNAFMACGWTDVSASGALFPVNGTRGFPVGAGTEWGYDVYAMNDASQSAAPIYVRVGYGTDAGAATTLKITFQVGFAQNNSGSITSAQSITRTVENNNNTSIWSGSLLYASGDGSRIQIYANPQQAGHPWITSLERTHDTNGGDTTEGVTLIGRNIAGAINYSDVLLPNTGTYTEAQWAVLMSQNNPSTFGGSVGYGVPFPYFGRIMNPIRGLLVIATNEVGTIGVVTSVPIYNVSQSYAYWGAQAGSLTPGNSPASAAWMRWE